MIRRRQSAWDVGRLAAGNTGADELVTAYPRRPLLTEWGDGCTEWIDPPDDWPNAPPRVPWRPRNRVEQYEGLARWCSVRWLVVHRCGAYRTAATEVDAWKLVDPDRYWSWCGCRRSRAEEEYEILPPGEWRLVRV